MTCKRLMRVLVVLSIATTMASGCGGKHEPEARSESSRPAAASAVAEYLDAVTAIHEMTIAARRRYFRGSEDPSRVIVQVHGAQAAYAKAARRMAALRPPTAAARVHRQLTTIYGAAADKLARVLARKPFNPGRANTILDELEKVTIEDVKAAAGRWLVPANRTSIDSRPAGTTGGGAGNGVAVADVRVQGGVR